MNRRSIAILQQMGIPVWQPQVPAGEIACHAIKLAIVVDREQQSRSVYLAQGIAIALALEPSEYIVIDPQQLASYQPQLLLWFASAPASQDTQALVGQFQWDALEQEPLQKRLLWKMLTHVKNQQAS